MDYGVGVQNRYAFLEDDVEDFVEDAKKLGEVSLKDKKLGKKPEVSTSAQVKDKVKPKTTSAGGKDSISVKPGFGKETEPSSRGRGGSSGRGRGTGARPVQDRNKENFNEESSSRGGFSSRGGGRGRGRGGSGNSGGRPIKESNNDFDEWGTEPVEDLKHGGVPEFTVRGRGSSRGGSGAGGRGGFTRRRDFDRQSGSDRSGVKPVDKREGGGARNWGSYKDEIDGGGVESETRTGEDQETVEVEKVAENGQGDAGVHGMIREKPEGMADGEVEEPKMMTLGEWKASMLPRETPTFNIRKPNEGTDPSQWKNLILKKKEKEEDDEYYEEGLWIPQRAGRQKRITDIGFHFQDDGDREARRGFRAPRGGRRNFENRQETNRNREPNPPCVDDVNDFPSLGIC